MKFEPCWSWEMVCSYSAADAGANLEFGSREGQQLADFVEKLPGPASLVYY
jgi:hypothetical protein